jgi:hypothetical protein
MFAVNVPTVKYVTVPAELLGHVNVGVALNATVTFDAALPVPPLPAICVHVPGVPDVVQTYSNSPDVSTYKSLPAVHANAEGEPLPDLIAGLESIVALATEDPEVAALHCACAETTSNKAINVVFIVPSL